MADALSRLSDAGLAFLTLNTVLAFYRSRSDPWTAAFVAQAYVTLLLLFYCLRALEKLPRGEGRRREKLKLAVLVLATVLNVTFSHQVSKILPPGLSVLVWGLSCSVTAGGFYAFYFVPE